MFGPTYLLTSHNALFVIVSLQAARSITVSCPRFCCSFPSASIIIIPDLLTSDVLFLWILWIWHLVWECWTPVAGLWIFSDSSWQGLTWPTCFSDSVQDAPILVWGIYPGLRVTAPSPAASPSFGRPCSNSSLFAFVFPCLFGLFVAVSPLLADRTMIYPATFHPVTASAFLPSQ